MRVNCPNCLKTVEVHIDETRTRKQQSALEVYCRELAKALNESGQLLRMTFPWGKEIEIPWSQSLVKDRIWRPIQRAMLYKKSTTGLSKKEVNEVYEVVSMNIAQSCGVSLEFPSREPEL